MESNIPNVELINSQVNSLTKGVTHKNLVTLEFKRISRL